MKRQVIFLIEQRRKLQAYYRKTISGFAMPPGEEQSLEAKFLGKVRAAVEDNLDDENFSVVELGKIVGMSRSQLHRKLTALTGFSPNEVIRNMRLEYARRLLESKSGTVSEIAYRSGFISSNASGNILAKPLAKSAEIQHVRLMLPN